MRDLFLCLFVVAAFAVVASSFIDSKWWQDGDGAHAPRKSTEHEQYQPIVPSKGFKYEA
ncbi:hypothetical protein [Burkholderia sp. Bp8990]|uniref:hypothetical protein n=1 Tax=Burkholderia sp. Bp8990 TaxID=2184552 RepID=UPI00162A7652|nr:hypothetical protein [Burkholderia sp. Bp8990]